MNIVNVGILVASLLPAAPAPKAAPGIPKELIDLLPEDTAAVLVMDGTRITKSAIGAAFIRALTAEQKSDEAIRIADVAKDVQFALIAQFLIESHAGDFCFVLRVRDGSGLVKALMAEAAREGRAAVPERIGKRTVHSIGSPSASFASLDERTLMVVLASGNEKQIQETRAAAYGEREKPGPSPTLRRMLTDEPADVAAIRLYGHHPTKLGHSAGLVMTPFGVKFEPLAALGEKVVSYRGTIRLGDAADVQLRFTMRDVDAAREFLKAYDNDPDDDPAVLEWRRACKADREGDDVVLTGKATRALLDRMTTRPNK